jgi:hypothetical protein
MSRDYALIGLIVLAFALWYFAFQTEVWNFWVRLSLAAALLATIALILTPDRWELFRARPRDIAIGVASALSALCDLLGRQAASAGDLALRSRSDSERLRQAGAARSSVYRAVVVLSAGAERRDLLAGVCAAPAGPTRHNSTLRARTHLDAQSYINNSRRRRGAFVGLALPARTELDHGDRLARPLGREHLRALPPAMTKLIKRDDGAYGQELLYIVESHYRRSYEDSSSQRDRAV